MRRRNDPLNVELEILSERKPSGGVIPPAALCVFEGENGLYCHFRETVLWNCYRSTKQIDA